MEEQLPAAILDLIDRLEDLAGTMAWLLPEYRGTDVELAMELTRLRALEAACMIANLAEGSMHRDQPDDHHDLNGEHHPRGNGAGIGAARQQADTRA